MCLYVGDCREWSNFEAEQQQPQSQPSALLQYKVRSHSLGALTFGFQGGGGRNPHWLATHNSAEGRRQCLTDEGHLTALVPT